MSNFECYGGVHILIGVVVRKFGDPRRFISDTTEGRGPGWPGLAMRAVVTGVALLDQLARRVLQDKSDLLHRQVPEDQLARFGHARRSCRSRLVGRLRRRIPGEQLDRLRCHHSLSRLNLRARALHPHRHRAWDRRGWLI
jgi:hypothetical protein